MIDYIKPNITPSFHGQQPIQTAETTPVEWVYESDLDVDCGPADSSSDEGGHTTVVMHQREYRLKLNR